MRSRSGELVDTFWRLGYRLAYQVLRRWWRLGWSRGRGAGVAAWSGGRLLVVRSSYRRRLELPGGGVGRGETALAAAVRELREETGIVVAPAALREATRLAFEQEGRAIVDTIFEWRPAARPEPRIDRREIVWAGWLTPAELARQPLSMALRLYLARLQETAGDGAGPASPVGRAGLGP